MKSESGRGDKREGELVSDVWVIGVQGEESGHANWAQSKMRVALRVQRTAAMTG